ncbi:hypothetical protein DM01DRAFT_1335793 [Hesseltinella vesiculosa]|uniref:CID domain-containing protein n=1 Tax=Hesseltinella vesiculosa TaxID=101127 RepID=A0A1X2GHH5_9FUNG|nr:hypothetical protein DM01DRAFT_1335793 [Hesseltinella vesiculosa]
MSVRYQTGPRPPPPQRSTTPIRPKPTLHDLRKAYNDRLRINSLESLLEAIMDDAVEEDVQDARGWILDHCTTPDLLDTVVEYVVNVAETTSQCSRRLPLLYVLDDVLVYAHQRKLDPWIKETTLRHIPELLYLIYEATSSDRERHLSKTEKVLRDWERDLIFDKGLIDELLVYMRHPPAIDMHRPCSLLPPGVLVASIKSRQPPYSPITPVSLHGPLPFVTETDLAAAVDEFYAGGWQGDKEPDSNGGWEKGYLDGFYNQLKRNMQAIPPPKPRNRSRSRSPSPRRGPPGRQRSPNSRFPRQRPPSPPNAGLSNNAAAFFSTTGDSKHMGLGMGASEQANDAFDDFRKRTSYTYSQDMRSRDRESTSGPKCFKCNQYGHIARNCPAL